MSVQLLIFLKDKKRFGQKVLFLCKGITIMPNDLHSQQFPHAENRILHLDINLTMFLVFDIFHLLFPQLS